LDGGDQRTASAIPARSGLYVATDRKIMHQQPSSTASVIAVGITTLAMFFAGFAMIWFP